ncbi:hypothetical protein DPMN_012868 [Dreissena polymorpha]|uniref:Fucosyltransferase n=1 Tax=Dreissena polymorpha TaxID=45954 RepID=A0A9D4N394_DREPO|nr:hypothetical protein DPMN_012868 [Dreissena polymorpha]
MQFMSTCEYNNCVISEDKHVFETASALIFAIAGGGMGTKPPLMRAQRNPNQAWVFYTLEPPMNLRQNDFKSPFWLKTMNWSMTYRFDSDVLAPYGTFRTRKVIPKRDYKTVFRRKTGMVAWVVSHCNAESERDVYVHDLRRHGVDVDIYGACGHMGQISEDAIEQLNKYKFFISFENALCTDYISCKVFKKFNLDLILIVRGGADYTRLMPSGTYINTDDFPTTADLATFILKLSWNVVLYTRILSQKDRYEVLNEDEFGYPYAMCDLCRRLNSLDKYRKQYDDMRAFLEAPQCRAPKDVNITNRRIYSPKHVYFET